MYVTESKDRLKKILENNRALYTTTNVIRMIKSSILRFQGHVFLVGDKIKSTQEVVE